MAKEKFKAIFCDRDGVLNHIEKNKYVTHYEDFELIPDAGRAIYLANELGFKVFVVTNQGGIGLGVKTKYGNIFDHNELLMIHKKMLKQIGWYSGVITDVFHCPHHPKSKSEQYNFECQCRKPRPGMLRNIMHRYDIDLSQSYMIGDSITDIECGEAAGCKKNILVLTGFGEDSHKEYVNRVINDTNYSSKLPIICNNLYEAVLWIQENEK